VPLCSSAEYNRILGAVRCDSDGIFRVWLTATPLSLVGRIIAQTMTSGALTGVVTEQVNPVLQFIEIKELEKATTRSTSATGVECGPQRRRNHS